MINLVKKMDNRKLGVILIVVCLVLGFLIFTFNQLIGDKIEGGCDLEVMQETGYCPMDDLSTPWQTYVGIVLVSVIAALGLYLIFFEKSQKAIIATLEKQKQIQLG